MTTENIDSIEGISVFVKINGKLCVAPIAKDAGTLFIGMLPAFQSGNPTNAKLVLLPEEIAKHVQAAGQAFNKAFEIT